MGSPVTETGDPRWTPPGFEHSHRFSCETDVRPRTVAALLHADPGRTATLTELGRAAGAGERTLSRHRWSRCP